MERFRHHGGAKVKREGVRIKMGGDRRVGLWTVSVFVVVRQMFMLVAFVVKATEKGRGGAWLQERLNNR